MCLWRSIQPISAHKNIHKTLGDNSNHKAISKTSYFANKSNRWTPAPINQQSGSRKMAIWFSDASLCRTSFPAKSSSGIFFETRSQWHHRRSWRISMTSQKKKWKKHFTGGSRASLQFNSSDRLPSRVMAALSFPAIGWHRWSPSWENPLAALLIGRNGVNGQIVFF